MSKHLKRIKSILILLLLLGITFSVKADFWELPTCKKYYSADSNSTVYVVPACIAVSRKRKRSLDTCSGDCPEKIPCRATVTTYKRENKGGDSSYSFELVNLYAPHQVFISNDGVYMVTVDDWGSKGKGENVLVIYKNGTLSRKYTLPQISPIPIWNYFESISSFNWFYQLHFINNILFKIYFRDKNGKQYEKYFHLQQIE